MGWHGKQRGSHRQGKDRRVDCLFTGMGRTPAMKRQPCGAATHIGKLNACRHGQRNHTPLRQVLRNSPLAGSLAA